MYLIYKDIKIPLAPTSEHVDRENFGKLDTSKLSLPLEYKTWIKNCLVNANPIIHPNGNIIHIFNGEFKIGFNNVLCQGIKRFPYSDQQLDNVGANTKEVKYNNNPVVNDITFYNDILTCDIRPIINGDLRCYQSIKIAIDNVNLLNLQNILNDLRPLTVKKFNGLDNPINCLWSTTPDKFFMTIRIDKDHYFPPLSMANVEVALDRLICQDKEAVLIFKLSTCQFI